MSWLLNLQNTNPTAQAIAILSLVSVLGMALGSIKYHGVKLGASGVLFVGLVVGHFTKPVDHHTLEFVKEFGLILFVFCIGLQLGPSFFASFRQAGLRLNALALAVVVMGAIAAVTLGWLLDFDGAAVLGIYAGASTNTPSLGAAQQTLVSFPDISAERAAMPALAYAVSYPMGIVGIIGTLLILKNIFRIDVARETADYEAAQRGHVEPLVRRTLVVENTNLVGLALGEIPGLREAGAVISRIRSQEASAAAVALADTRLRLHDRLLVVGTAYGLDQLQRVVGQTCHDDLSDEEGITHSRQVVVTNKRVLGMSVKELQLDTLFGVVVTRISRGDLEMTATPSLALQYGDVLILVGSAEGLDRAAAKLGNSVQALGETQFVPFFAGIALGIALGTMPLAIPGLPQPLRIGLAGGPLLVALVVGRLQHFGGLVWHIPRSANLAFREFGIALFFASVGLLAGPSFFATACSSAGLEWLAAGAVVTLTPILAVGIFSRKLLGMNYVALSGLLAGSMTDPPALAFAHGVCQSEAPGVAYATVYPLTMLLRIMTAQILAVLLCG